MNHPRANDQQTLLNALSKVLPLPSLGTWLQTPNDAFDGLKPMELIDRGQSDRLWEMIYNLRSGNPV